MSGSVPHPWGYVRRPLPTLRRVLVLDKLTRYEEELKERRRDEGKNKTQNKQDHTVQRNGVQLNPHAPHKKDFHLFDGHPPQEKDEKEEKSRWRMKELDPQMDRETHNIEAEVGRHGDYSAGGLLLGQQEEQEEDEQIAKELIQMFPRAYRTHLIHRANIQELLHQLHQHGIYTQIIKAQTVTTNWDVFKTTPSSTGHTDDTCSTVSSTTPNSNSLHLISTPDTTTTKDTTTTTDAVAPTFLFTDTSTTPGTSTTMFAATGPRITTTSTCAITANADDFDAVISAGGDGTYLEAASLIQPANHGDKVVWLFGINTDPDRSEGKLCIQPNLTLHEDVEILPTPKTECSNTYSRAASVSDHFLLSPSSDHSHVSGTAHWPTTPHSSTPHCATPHCTALHCRTPVDYIPRIVARLLRGEVRSLFRQRIVLAVEEPVREGGDATGSSRCHPLPYRAVNDVMISERQCSDALYAEVEVDDHPPERQKSSGIICCTGTGSSAWTYNISKLHDTSIQAVIAEFIEAQPEAVKERIVLPDVGTLRSAVNSRLLFHPSTDMIRYVVREPIENRVFSVRHRSGMCTRLRIRPLSREAFVFVDGMHKFPLPVGCALVLRLDPSAVVWTAR